MKKTERCSKIYTTFTVVLLLLSQTVQTEEVKRNKINVQRQLYVNNNREDSGP